MGGGELELAGLDGLDGLAAEAAVGIGAKPAHTHQNCLNCEAELHGRYCHDCGQNADDHHRSIAHLLWEAVEGFTHLDGRLAKTLPALLFRPGRLARDHIEGRRMRHVPPFRLFLICLLLFMFAAEAVLGGAKTTTATTTSAAGHTFNAGLVKVDVSHTPDAKPLAVKPPPVSSQRNAALRSWLKAHVGRAAANREYFLMLVFEWMHRLAVVLLPILAGLLTIVYVYKRKFYVYDHLVVSMQYLSFCFLLWAVVWIIPDPVQDWLFLPALIWTPFNLYLILRTAYGSSRVGAGLKAIGLWGATVATFAALLGALLLWTLNTV